MVEYIQRKATCDSYDVFGTYGKPTHPAAGTSPAQREASCRLKSESSCGPILSMVAKRFCWPGCAVASARRAICRPPTASGTHEAWRTTTERKFSSWRICLVGRLAVATEAALATLDHIWGVLEPLGHPMAVMGGISLAAWNHIRATRDVDLLIAIDRSAIDSDLGCTSLAWLPS